MATYLQRLKSADTIRDAILARARKPTRVSLIYRTERTGREKMQKPENTEPSLIIAFSHK